MLGLAPYLVKSGHFKRVQFNILVERHAKNLCDRIFNCFNED